MSTGPAILVDKGAQTFEKMALEHTPGKFGLTFTRVRSSVNSKLVRAARNIFIACLRVRQSKLPGKGTGYQLPPPFLVHG